LHGVAELGRFVDCCTHAGNRRGRRDRKSRARRTPASVPDSEASRLDLHTLFLAQTCLLAATAATLWVSRTDADRGNGMWMWRLAITSEAVAYLVLAIPAHGPAAMLSGLVANLAGAIGVALFFAAIRRFAGVGYDVRLLAAMIAAVTLAGAVTGEHVAWAAIFNGFAYAGYEWLNAFTLWRHPRFGTDRVQRVVAVAYACMGLVLPARAIALLVIGQSRLSLDHGDLWQLPIYVFGFVYLVVTNLGFVLMCKARAEAETRLQARTDELTDLPNRRALDEEIARALAAARRSGRPFGIVMVDVDRFKFINDTHGHAVGDATLTAFARRLAGALREPDRAYRYGGEEFCVLLADTDLAGARTLAERAREHIELPFEGTMRALSASFGVTAWQADDTGDTLFRRADRALYAAKANGRNRVETA
jgi:diguanylate cyclase (GGDEF)-like protein